MERAEKSAKKPNPYSKCEKVEKEKPLEDDDSNVSKCFDEDPEIPSDWRKTPEWNVSYKQRVTASDVFLGVRNFTTHVLQLESKSF